MSTRREFVVALAGAGGALVLGVGPPLLASSRDGTRRAPFRPNVWIRVDDDGTVTVVVGKSEMGQGVRTGLPMIVAEELDVPLERVRLEQASPGPDFPSLGTGGSGSTMGSWEPLRHAGAAARAMLVAAASTRWGVDPGACRTQDGAVIHDASGRRLSYAELTADAARQPVPQHPPLKDRSDYRIIGTEVPRMDGPDIVSGRARYGLDVQVPGMRYAVVARAPRLGGRVASFDDRRARRVDGVLDVVELPAGVAVVGEHTWAALQGRDALAIRWRDGPGASFDTDRHRERLEAATAEPGVTIRRDGSGREAFAGAARRLEAVYHYPFEAHAAIEPVNCTALVEGDRCQVWSPTQTPNAVQAYGARLLGIPAENLTVHVTLLGGGFGRRLGWDFDMEAIRIARALPGTPVHLLWTREDDLRHGYFQAASAHRLLAGLDGEGRILAWEHREAATPHQARGVPTPAQLRDPAFLRASAWGVYDTPYAFPAFEASYAVVEAPVPIGPWRAVFSPPAVFARECFLDEVAGALDRDPLELRLELLDDSDRAIDATFVVDGDLVDRRRMRAVLETVAEEGGWGRNAPEGRALGLAGNVFHTGTYMAYVVEVSLRRDAAPGELPFN
ncbi:MAG TPA: molybdopterin cofactor-binding domain-containing protein, partial [Longimicrobiales bacterium]|nr:molybdopterin cofactor-binding domain-containing protein [Longimicrobiales bacterium]